jgi:5'-AMP-activated protein kinase catalytic alpha subunit
MTSRSSKSNGNNKNHQNNRTLNNLMIGDFKIGTKLGQGTFSKVCQGIHMPTGEKVAIKIMSKDQIKEKSDQIRIEKEINIQKKLHHQNIVQQYAIIETESTIYIISEYCSGGELFDYIVSKRKLYEVEACRIYQQLISGLEYLHKQRICNRELKPENLLFDSKHN